MKRDDFSLFEQRDLVSRRAGKSSCGGSDEKDLDFKVTGITSFNTAPRKYVLEITPTAREPGKMEINDATLFKLPKFERAYRECFNRAPRGMPTTSDGWKQIVNAWLDRSVVVDVVPEPSKFDELCETLIREIREMSVSQDYTEFELDCSRVLVTPSGERIFKGTALRSNLEDVTRKSMGVALRRIGCRSKSVRISKGTFHIWTIPQKLWNDAA